MPHGYLKVDLEPPAERLIEMARQIDELPDRDFRERADRMFRLYAIIVTMLQKQWVQGCALGMHPGGDGSLSLSVLTVSTLSTPEADPKAALAGMLAGEEPDSGNGVVPVGLPVGTGFLREAERRTVVPGVPLDGQGGTAEESVWQGTIAIPVTRSSSVITVQLVTPSSQLVDDYRGVLMGVARTVTFTDPAASREGDDSPGPLTASGSGSGERSPFG
nr:hypothetical protein [Streptomyces harenosi]